ncbi:MAG: DUF2587 domain-containing protein [Acidimicrobiia bacterium]|nr:DUF2587 domain-containing protein [Acidimicrobiia bacterium]
MDNPEPKTEPVGADQADDTSDESVQAIQPQVVEEPAEPAEDDGTFVSEPARLIRIASMTRAMLDEVRQAELDDPGRARLMQIYSSSMSQLRDSLSDDLQVELDEMFGPLEGADVTESELRIVQAQLVGWLEGLFHGIQASIFSQQAAAAAQVEEMRRRLSLEAGTDSGRGQYL